MQGTSTCSKSEAILCEVSGTVSWLVIGPTKALEKVDDFCRMIWNVLSPREGKSRQKELYNPEDYSTVCCFKLVATIGF
jgi:hypothetical protein